MRNPHQAKLNPLMGEKLAAWKRLDDEGLAELIVSPERAAWICRRYPESDSGRPGIIHTDSRDRGNAPKIRKADVELDDPADLDVGVPSWRVTQEFPSDESALGHVEIAVSAAAD
jgi:hypothetical protein